jgi:hypothetical protein
MEAGSFLILLHKETIILDILMDEEFNWQSHKRDSLTQSHTITSITNYLINTQLKIP